MRAIVVIGALLGGCADGRSHPAPSERPRLLVVGIDGASPVAIRRLIKAGDLPNFKRVLERGWMVPLETAYAASPLIWTTMATGVRPEEHGISEFLVQSERGLVPISSAARRRPALWNMLDRVQRRAAVLGFWASWPAEPTRGLIVSDRIGVGLPNEISPPERADDLAVWIRLARAGGIEFGRSGREDTDERIVLNERVVTLAALQTLHDGGFDLIFAYYRSVDVTSHSYWHLFEHESFPLGPPRDALEPWSPNPVADAYRAVDTALGELLNALPSDWDLMIVSDHGFQSETTGKANILLDLDRVLEELGFLKRLPDQTVDNNLSRAWSEPPFYEWTKRIRLSPSLAGPQREAVARELVAKVKDCTFSSGRPAFALARTSPRDRQRGVDIVFELQVENATNRLTCGGREVAGAVPHFQRQTGVHFPETRGILITAGPSFRLGPLETRASIFDIAPTILYALGLPTARDFAGRALLELFEPAVVARRPLRQIASWGTRQAAPASESAADEKLLDELAALGYLN